MTARFVSSSPTERAFTRVKSWQHPSRREHVHGRIQPMEQRRDWSAKWFIALAAVIAAFFALQLVRGWL